MACVNSLACRWAAVRQAHASLLDAAARTTTTNASAALSFSPQTTAFIFSLLALFLLLYLAASHLDILSRQHFHAALKADADLRTLAHCQAASGHTFIYDRILDAPADAALPPLERPLAPLQQRQPAPALGAAAPSLLHPVLLHSSPPQEQVLFKEHAPTPEEERAHAWVAQPSHGQCCSRLHALRGFLLRYTLLRVYFTHPLLSPFTTFSPISSRANRLALALTSLLLSHWAGAVLYSFKVGGVGVLAGEGDASAETTLLPLLVFTLVAVPAQQLVLALLKAAVAAAEERAYHLRYPYVALEAARREAAECSLALLTPSDLSLALQAIPQEAAAPPPPPPPPPLPPAAAAGMDAVAPPPLALHAPPPPSLLVLCPPDSLLVRSAAEAHLPPPPSAAKPLPQSLAWAEHGEEEQGVGGVEAKGEAPAPAAAPESPPAPSLLACCARGKGSSAGKEAAAAAAAAAAAKRALDSVAARMRDLEAAEAAAAAAALAGAQGAVIGATLRRAAALLLTPQACLVALYALLLALFLWYTLLFALVQGDPVASAYTASWVASQVANFFLITPALMLGEACVSHVLWPTLGPLLCGARAARAPRQAGAAAQRDTALMMMRAAGLASSLPPGLAFLSYGLALASSTTSSLVGAAALSAAQAVVKTEERAALDAAVASARQKAPRLSRRARRDLVVRRHVLERVEAAEQLRRDAAGAQPEGVEVAVEAEEPPPQTPPQTPPPSPPLPPPPPPPPPPHTPEASGRRLHAFNLAPLGSSEGKGGGEEGGGSGEEGGTSSDDRE